MENQIDSFIEYLFIVEESNESLTQDQIRKLEMIKTKVTELVNKVESISVNQQAPQQILEPALAEDRVARLAEYQALNEKAIKQLQAIEISKAGR